jgi:hypothetical protein
MPRYILDSNVWIGPLKDQPEEFYTSSLFADVWLSPANLYEAIHVALKNQRLGSLDGYGQLKVLCERMNLAGMRMLPTPQEALAASIREFLGEDFRQTADPKIVKALKSLAGDPHLADDPSMRTDVVNPMEHARNEFAREAKCYAMRVQLFASTHAKKPKEVIGQLEEPLILQVIAECDVTCSGVQRQTLFQQWRNVPGLREYLGRFLEVLINSTGGRKIENMESDFFDLEFAHHLGSAVLITDNTKDFVVEGKLPEAVKSWTDFIK